MRMKDNQETNIVSADVKYSRKEGEGYFFGLGKATRGDCRCILKGGENRGRQRGREMPFQVGGGVGVLGFLLLGIRAVIDAHDPAWSGAEERRVCG